MTATGGSTARTPRAGERRTASAARLVAGMAGMFFVVSGAAAFLVPAAFFDAAAAFAPYNEHFVRDIGAFQVGLGVVLLLAVWIDDALTVALGGVGVGSLVHTVGHVIDRHLGGTPLVDVPFFGALSILLLAVGALRWRSISRAKEPG